MRKSILVPGSDRSDTIDLPVGSALIRHKQGNILFDTGCHPAVVDHPQERWGGMAKIMQPIMSESDTLLASLKCTAVDPDDIDLVINSHFHPDHCGCNAFFKRATVIAQAKEIEAAHAPNAEAAGYLSDDFDGHQTVEAVNGQKDLFDDNRITLIPLPGHTPGSMGALVNLDRDGSFLLAADALTLRLHLDTDIVPKNITSADDLFKSFAEIRRIEKSGATVICGHDEAQWQSLRKGNEGYE
jgi:glyoxylase-like metal-dependent hydrolase (beta-lactamase superfamily II)